MGGGGRQIMPTTLLLDPFPQIFRTTYGSGSAVQLASCPHFFLHVNDARGYNSRVNTFSIVPNHVEIDDN